MKITVVTLFPEMFTGPMTTSIMKRAQQKGLLEIEYINIRNFGLTKHQVVDDTPYGGGLGMVMRVDVLHEAIKQARDKRFSKKEEKVVLLDARGEKYQQKKALELSQLKHLIFVCGHYEGVDERIRKYVDITISIGDFIVTGGEIPAMMIIDSVVRVLPGVITESATVLESFTEPLLEYPQYTKPQSYDGEHVPDILLSGNHQAIDIWRKEQAEKITKEHRPDLLNKS